MSILMNYMSSRECKAYLDKGGDLVLVPLGTVARLGPHLPLGARGMVVSAIARLMAEKYDGLSLTLIPYSTVYDTFNQLGSMDIPPELMHKYCYNLCDELVANGFKRIIFISFQEELYYLSNEYFQEHNMAVIYMNPNSFFNTTNSTVSSLDVHGKELWRLVACLNALGDAKMLERIFEKTQTFFHDTAPEWQFYPVNLGKGLEEPSAAFEMPGQALLDKATAELHSWIDNFSQPIADLSLYQNYLNGLTFKRPI